jgi:hypothetical protein
MYNGVYDSDPSIWSDPFILYINGDIRTRVVPFDSAIGAYTNIWEKYRHLGNELEASYNGVSHSGHKCIKMKWSGDFSETFEKGDRVNNAAFWFTTTNNGSGKNLTFGKYTKISFWCKTELASDTEVVINVFGHEYPSKDIVIPSSENWKHYEVDISSYNASSVKSYISVTMQPNSTAPIDSENNKYCGGGTIYLDDIRLSR